MTVIEQVAAVGTLQTPPAPPPTDAGGLPPEDHQFPRSGGWRWIPDPDEGDLPSSPAGRETSLSAVVLQALAWATLHLR